MEDVDLGEPTSFLDHVYLGCTLRDCQMAIILWRTTEICSNPGFLLEPKKNDRPELQGNLKQKQYFLGPMTWKATQRNVWKDIACRVATPCMDDHQFKEQENESAGEKSTVCSQIVLKCLFWLVLGDLIICGL